jgi:cytochrome c551/c552
MKELRLYKDRLSDSIKAWEIFKQTELQCFDDIEDVLGPSFDAIDKAFSNLEDARRRVVDMIEEICQDYPQGVSHNILL